MGKAEGDSMKDDRKTKKQLTAESTRRKSMGSEVSKNRTHPLEGIGRENIKITDIKVTLLSYRLKPEEQWADGDSVYAFFASRSP